MLTEALLAAITEAVFGSLLEHTSLPEKTCAWLGLDSQLLAFQVALTRALSMFARAYPQWVASLFDEYFLIHYAAPLLACTIKRDDTLIPVELAITWADQMELNEVVRVQLIAELTPIASNFIRWLETELRTLPEFQPLFDSRTFDEIDESSQQTLQAQEQLKTELKAVLSTLQQVAKYQVTTQQAQGIVIGDFNTVINHFIAGVRDLPTDYAGRVKNFLIEYLGTPDHPVPFGGREKDFALLNSWLDDRLASPYLLLAAPAGRGKTALLTRWSRTLLERHDVAVAYFPVSIRFRTNLASVVFPALVARLASLHGDKVPTDLNTSEEVWRGLLTDYLTRPLPDGRRLVLILDGVDEAADWEPGADLFPLDPPSSLRIVISARNLANDRYANTWLNRFGWTRRGLARALPLHSLDQTGVADVLRKMDFPLDRLSTRIDIVAELHRLSEGDPLLVRLYVDDLWERGEMVVRLQPEDLRSIRPGLVGYFDRWWEDQRRLWGKETRLREPAVQVLLNLLACALGPLSRDDLLHLVPVEMKLKTWDLESHLEFLKRFVIGDGKQQGYVFSHPRLSNYFYEERLSETERQETENRFLEWGEKSLVALNEGRLLPEQASSYIIQYYGIHLERANCDTEAFLSLISNGWRQAWEKLEGTHAGFLSDTERAWRAAELANEAALRAGHLAPYLGGEIRCALCLASVNSLVKNIPPAIIWITVEKGIWTPAQGLTYARQVPNLDQRVRALIKLVGLLPEQLKAEVVGEVLKLVRAMKDERFQAGALGGLAPTLSELLQWEVLEMAQGMKNKRYRVEVLSGLAPFLPKELNTKVLGEALELVREMKDERFQVEALTGLASTLPRSLHREALELVRAMKQEYWRTSEYWQAMALFGLAPSLSRSMLWEALDIIRSLKNEGYQLEALLGLVSLLHEPLRFEVVQEILEKVKARESQYWQIGVLVRLDYFLPEALLLGGLEELSKQGYPLHALKAAQAIKNEKYRVEILSRLIPSLPKQLKTEVLQEALETARTIDHKGFHVEALTGLIPSLPEQLKTEVLQEALETARTIDHKRSLVEALTDLVPLLSKQLKTEVLQETLEIAWTISHERVREEALAKMIPFLTKPLLQRALEIARAIRDADYQVQLLVELAPSLPKSLLQEVLQIVRTMDDEEYRIYMLSKLVSSLPEQLKIDVLREILERVWVIEDEEYQTQVLAEIASSLSESQLREALKIVRAMQHPEYQAEALVGLIPSLSEPLLQEVLEIVRTMREEEYQAETLVRLIPSLSEPLLQEVLEIVRTMRVEMYRSMILLCLAPWFSEPLLREGLEIGRIVKEEYRAGVMFWMACRLAELGYTQEALEIVRTMDDEQYLDIVEALAELSCWLREGLEIGRIMEEEYEAEAWYSIACWIAKSGYTQEALKIVRTMDDEEHRAKTLVKLASLLPESLLREALEMARAINHEGFRVVALAGLIPSLPEQLKTEVLQEALEISRAIDDEGFRVEALNGLVPLLSEQLKTEALREVLEITRAITDVEYQVWMLVKCASLLSEQRWQEVLQIVRTIDDAEYQAEVLSELALFLPEPSLSEVLEIAQAIEDAEYRTEVLVVLASRLEKLPPVTLYSLWRQTLHFISHNSRQALITDLLTLIPVIFVLGGTEAKVDTSRALLEVGYWWP